MTFSGKPTAAHQSIIWDGTKFLSQLIQNDNIDPSATIDGSKIVPDFGFQNIITTGNLIVGSSGVSISVGVGVPSTTPNNGSIFLRTNGSSSTGIYTYQSGSWSAVGGGGSFTAAGDLSGSSSSQTVIGIQTNPVDATVLGASQDGYVLTWVDAGTNWIAKPPSGGGFTAGGDLSGTSSSQTVNKINGTTVPVGGSLTTGNGLYVSGTSALSYSALNLAGGSNFITGTLPSGNQAAQTMSGDVSGTTASSSVDKIKGTTVSTAGGSLTTGQVLRVSGASAVDYGPLDLANSSAITGILPTANQANQSLGGDLSGTTASATVIKLQGNAIQSGANGANQDGYILTWINSASQYQVKPTSSTIVAGQNYQFSNTSSDVSGYNQLFDNATGSESDLSAASASSSKVLIKAFASIAASPQIELIPAGLWEFNFYAYASLTGAFTTSLVFDVYTRTAGGVETLLFSATSSNIQVSSVTAITLLYNNPTDTFISNTTRLVIKVYGQTTNIVSTTVHFVFDGTTHASLVRTPITGASLQLGGDLSGTTSSASVININGSSVPIGGSLITGNGLYVSGTSALTYSALNLAGGSNYVSGVLPTGNQASQSLGGDLSGTTASGTVAKINGTTVSAGGSLTTGNGLYVSGGSALTYSALNLAGGSNYVSGLLPTGNQASQSLSGDLSGTTASATVIKLQGKAVVSQTLGASQDGYVLTWDNADGYWRGAASTGGGGGPPSGSAGGDLSGTYPNPTVAKINTTSVPAGGSLTTGNGLYVSGSSALSYSALNLAGGANFVTGSLPSANQVAQTLGGDASGTTAAATITKLQGNSVKSGTLTSANDGYVLTWVNSATDWEAKLPSSMYGTFATRPAAGQAGRLYHTSDGIIPFVDDGTNWRPYFGGFAGTQPPAAASWTATPSATHTTFTDKFGAIFLNASTTSSGATEGAEMTLSGAPYTIEAVYYPLLKPANNSETGIGIRDSGGGKVLLFDTYWATGVFTVQVVQLTTLTSFSSTPFSASLPFRGGPIHLRIRDDNTTLFFEYTTDGKNFLTLYSQLRTAWLPVTATRAGIYCGISTQVSSQTLISWSVT